MTISDDIEDIGQIGAVNTDLPNVTDAPWFEQAAAEARAASRRYWAKGGPADTQYPVQEDIYAMWPIAEPVAELQPRTRRGKAFG
jgi:hypothetical protein